MPNDQTFMVALPHFEGPLDLLLSLIERRELEVTELSISKVTGDYLAALAALEQTHAEDLRWFLDIGGRLVSYKTRALRKEQALDTDEDSLEDLASQVSQYQAWRKLAHNISNQFAAPLLVNHLEQESKRQAHQPPANLNITNLERAWRRVIGQKPVKQTVRHSVRVSRVQIQRTMQRLLKQLSSQTNLQDHLGVFSRQDRALNLLALLELIKEDLVELLFENETAYVKAT